MKKILFITVTFLIGTNVFAFSNAEITAYKTDSSYQQINTQASNKNFKVIPMGLGGVGGNMTLDIRELLLSVDSNLNMSNLSDEEVLNLVKQYLTNYKAYAPVNLDSAVQVAFLDLMGGVGGN